MDTKITCQHCGKALGPEAIEGLCPDCLMKMGLGIGTEASGAAPQGKRAFTPPTPAELAPKFSQLEILALIGQGGMGAVYKARQRQLDRVVALKILPPGIGEDLAFADRFAREAKAMAKLNHPGIVTIHDFGHAGGLYYFIMELVDGVSLRLLMNNGRVSPREALAIVPQICDALQYAHDQGIVHRDIKPENILLDRQGRVKVADFGLAKLVGAPNESVTGGAITDSSGSTEAGKVMGTPHYMAPEQVDHPGEVDHRADIYALGVVLYQMLTGELPAKRIEPPSKKVKIDVRLDEVVLRALEAKPERRYQQASQVKTAVETIRQTPARESQEKSAEPALAARTRGINFHLKWTVPVGLASLGAILAIWVLLRKTPVPTTSTPVFAIAAQRGDIGVYIACVGTVESSNTVGFAIPESKVQEVVHRLDAHQPCPMEAYDRDGNEFGHGELVAVDNRMDEATGTLKCKATLVSEMGKQMVPGLFLNIRMLAETKAGVVRVPDSAIIHPAHAAPFVWVIKSDQVISPRTVQVGTVEDKKTPEQSILDRMMGREDEIYLGPWAEIRSGLSLGELVVINLAPDNRLRDGQKVRYQLAQTAPPQSAAQPGTAQPKPVPEWTKIKPLSGWIADIQNPEPGTQKLAERAIAELGTNALPEFLKILADQDRTVEGDERRYNAASALKFIGPDLKSAIPSFTSLLLSGDQETAYAGARGLAFTTPIVPEAFTQLTNGLVHPLPGVRDAATHGVSLLLGSESNSLAKSALPTLLHNLKDQAQFVRADTAGALSMFVQFQQTHGQDAKPDLIIPPLIELLQDPYSYARQNVEMALSYYGQDAVPVLSRLLNDPDSRVREAATNAISKIGSRAAPPNIASPQAVKKQ